MNVPRREFLLGSLIVLIIICSLINLFVDAVRQFQTITPVANDVTSSTIIALMLTLSGFGSVIVGGFIASGIGGNSWEKLRQLNLRATIPVYFVFALVPITNGVVLAIFNGSQWGFWLSYLSIPAIAVYLLLGIRSIK